MRRRRETRSNDDDESDHKFDMNQRRQSKRKSSTSGPKPHKVSIINAIITTTAFFALFWFVYYLDTILPTPLMIRDEVKHPDEFIAERAQVFLKKLTDIGPKVAGSHENEVLAVKLIEREIKNVINSANAMQFIETDKQVVSGSYYLAYIPDGTINTYSNVQNIIVKLHGNDSKQGILVNAHFDTVPTSPGASDDGIMCAIMLECLRKLSQRNERLKEDVIFLFNGAEETPLQASHGFITQHKWANDTKFIINLEAAGNGGKEMLFQTGPTADLLLSIYGAVTYPLGNAIGEEIFQANLIPSDTDFRIFRDFGKLKGFDFAFIRNGYRYHTKYDRIDNIGLGSYQHTGSNILSLIKELSKKSDEALTHNENSVYYDVFGWFFIYYRNTIGIIINSIIVVLSIIVTALGLRDKGIKTTKQDLKTIALTLSMLILMWISSVIVTLFIAYMLDLFLLSMRWYGNPVLIFGLYVAPVLGVQTLVLFIFNHFQKSDNVEIQIHLMRFIWTVLLLAGTALNIRASYAIMYPICFNMLWYLINKMTPRQAMRKMWHITYYLLMLIPAMYFMYLAITVILLFIPITGRMGSNKNPEFLIGILITLLTILTTSYFVPLINLVRKPFHLMLYFFAIFLITFAFVVTPITFPYSGNFVNPTPQRFIIYHTNRLHTDELGNKNFTSGIVLFNNDRNSPHSIKDFVPELASAQSLQEDCIKYPACGMPMSHVRMLQLMSYSTWIPFASANIANPSSLVLDKREIVSENVVRLSFTAQGPDHTTIFLRPKQNVSIINSSLAELKTNGFLFINYVYGVTKSNLTFHIDLQSSNIDEKLIDVAVSGKFFNTPNHTSEFQTFLKSFPDWADIVSSSADYLSFVY